MKLGVFGVDNPTYISKLWIGVYLTNGQSTSKPDLFYYILYKAIIDLDNNGVCHVILTSDIDGDDSKCHMIIDTRTLDFTNISSVEGYSLLLNEDIIKSISLLIKKRKSNYYPYSKEYIPATGNDFNNPTDKQRAKIATVGAIIDIISYTPQYYKLQYYDKILCAGDSVTKGYVVEGTQSNPERTHMEIPGKSYPAGLEKLLPKADITVKATTGISATGWLNAFYPNIDFSDYEMMIIELGLNGSDYGYLNIDDIDTPGTNTYAYRQIIKGVRQQNSEMVIAMVRSSHFISGTGIDAIEYIANESNCMVIDLQSTESKSIINLDDAILHGYYNNNGTPAIDWAHFTRKGYMCKAYVISRMIEVRLSNVTDYSE